MKFFLGSMALLIFSSQALAETTALFPSEKKGIVLLQNGKTADADFFWDILAVSPVSSGLNHKKTFTTQSGDFSAVCSRADTTPTATTSCTLTFSQVELGGVISVSKQEKRISGLFVKEVAAGFTLPQELVHSPDRLLTVCTVCGIEGAGLTFSITWQK